MAEYLAGSILLAFGLYSLITSRKEDANARRMSTTRGLALIGLGLGISVDSLAIGFSYGLLKIPALLATTVIVVQTIIATQFGFSLGKLLPSKFRVFGEGLAGLVLAVIGGFIIISKALS
jgi:putative Mn2+ efflux pump MntP